jgi:hypothetical protein
VLLGGIASIGLSSLAVVNSLTGLGTLFVANTAERAHPPLVVAALRRCSSGRKPHHRGLTTKFVLGLGVPEEASIDPDRRRRSSISCRCPSRRRPHRGYAGACSPQG